MGSMALKTGHGTRKYDGTYDRTILPFFGRCRGGVG